GAVRRAGGRARRPPAGAAAARSASGPGRTGCGVTDLFLGVDAGNTKTIAAVADRSGVVLGRALGGTGDIYGVADPTEATAEVLRLVDRALAEARAALPDGAPGRIAAAAFRLAGVDWPEDERLWADVLRDHFDRDRHG